MQLSSYPEKCSFNGMTQLPTAGGHPQSSRLVEQYNRVVLSKHISKKGQNWIRCWKRYYSPIEVPHINPQGCHHFTCYMAMALSYYLQAAVSTQLSYYKITVWLRAGWREKACQEHGKAEYTEETERAEETL